MCGPEVVEEAKRLNPEIKVLLMSGYAENALRNGGHGHVAGAIKLLDKPFRKRDLAQRLREALEKNNLFKIILSCEY